MFDLSAGLLHVGRYGANAHNVRPVPSGSVEHLLEHTGAHGETRRWNKELWRWEPKPKGHRRLRLEQQQPPEPEPELFTESELQRTFSEPTLQLDTRPGQERTVTEKELDHHARYFVTVMSNNNGCNSFRSCGF